MTLIDIEIEALAVLLIAWQLEHAEWFGWEDLPELDEATFEAVVARVQTRGRSLRSWLTGYEIDHEIDAHEIHGRAQG